MQLRGSNEIHIGWLHSLCPAANSTIQQTCTCQLEVERIPQVNKVKHVLAGLKPYLVFLIFIFFLKEIESVGEKMLSINQSKRFHILQISSDFIKISYSWSFFYLGQVFIVQITLPLCTIFVFFILYHLGVLKNKIIVSILSSKFSK